MSTHAVELASVCRMDRRTTATSEALGHGLEFVGMEHVDPESGQIVLGQGSRTGDGKGQAFMFDDRHVLFGKLRPYLRKIALPRQPGCASTELVPLLPDATRLDRGYLFHWLRRGCVIDSLMAKNTGARMPRADMSVLFGMSMPLPSLGEQRRIVRLLDRAAEIRRRADAARAKARAIIPALFLDTFGDPATNPKGWPIESLSNNVSLVGGGTPSKARAEFWNGNIPWVSPKDMKPPIISDSEDKITEAAMASSPVRLIAPGNVLVVVRGMILAHTVPIRTNRVAVTLNQDMKALVPGDRLNAAFLRWMLQAAHDYLLGKVRESAHGTRKLETSILTSFPTMLPPLALQTAFAQQAWHIEATARALDAAAAKAEAMAAALSAEVFG